MPAQNLALTLTEEIIPQDSIDDFLLEEILLSVQNRDVLEHIKYWGNSQIKKEKSDEVYLMKIMFCVKALMKANSLRRSYILVKDDFLEKIPVEQQADLTGTNVNLMFNKIECISLTEAFLTQIKTALDLLAQSFSPIYGPDIRTWKRKKVGDVELSGMGVVNSLEKNVNTSLFENVKPVIDSIKLNAQSITNIVKNRDGAVHYGGVRGIKGFRYNVSTSELSPPVIKVTETEYAFIDEYMESVLKYISEFVQEIVFLTISNIIDPKNAKNNA